MRRLAGFTAIGVIVTGLCVLIVSAVGWFNGERAIDNAVHDELLTRRSNRAAHVAAHVDGQAAQLSALAADLSVQETARRMVTGHVRMEEALEQESVSDDAERALVEWMERSVVSQRSPERPAGLPADRLVPGDVLGQTILVNAVAENPAAIDGSHSEAIPPSHVETFRTARERLAPRAQRLGFDDLLLVDSESKRVIWSVGLGPDLGADLERGYLRGSGLAEAARVAIDNDFGVWFSDFAHYEPDLGSANAFFSILVPVPSGAPPVLVGRVTTEGFDELLEDKKGWAPSAVELPIETNIVGRDGHLRANPAAFQRSPESYLALAAANGASEETLAWMRSDQAALALPVASPLVTDAFIEERSTVGFSTNATEQDVLMGVERVPTTLVDWVVTAEVDRNEALAPLRRFGMQAAALALITIVASCLVLWLVNRWLFRPRARLEEVAESVLDGDLTERVGDDAGDELAAAGNALDRLLDRVSERTAVVERAEADVESIRQRVLPASLLEPQAGHAQVLCCLVANPKVIDAHDLATVDSVRDAMANLRSMSVSHGMRIERVEGSSLLVSADEDQIGRVVRFAQDAVSSMLGRPDDEAAWFSAGIGVGDLEALVIGTSRTHVIVSGSAVREAEDAQLAAPSGAVAFSARAVSAAERTGIALTESTDGTRLLATGAEVRS